MTDVDLLRTNTSHESAPHYFNDGKVPVMPDVAP